jgi:hypothetical protein
MGLSSRVIRSMTFEAMLAQDRSDIAGKIRDFRPRRRSAGNGSPNKSDDSRKAQTPHQSFLPTRGATTLERDVQLAWIAGENPHRTCQSSSGRTRVVRRKLPLEVLRQAHSHQLFFILRHFATVASN